MASDVFAARVSEFADTWRNESLSQARIEAAKRIYDHLQELKAAPWPIDGADQRDLSMAADLGMMSLDNRLRDSIICYFLEPDMFRDDSGRLAQLVTSDDSPEVIPLFEKLNETCWNDISYDPKNALSVYKQDIPVFMESMGYLLPPDFAAGPFEVAAFVSWAQGDDLSVTNGYAAAAINADRLCGIGTRMSSICLYDKHPAWMEAAKEDREAHLTPTLADTPDQHEHYSESDGPGIISDSTAVPSDDNGRRLR